MESNRKKILHIQVLPKLSGVQKISLEIFKGLPENEYDKWILFSNGVDKGDMQECIDQFEKTGAKVILSSKLKREIGFHDYYAIKDIYNLCKKERFDIVHTHSSKPGIVGRIAATFAGIGTVIHTVHGISFHQFVKFPLRLFYWICEIFASLFCDKIILVNRYYVKYYPGFKKKIITIYNGFDYSLFKNQLCHNVHSKKDNNQLRFVFVGRLDEQKDPITLLKAFCIVLKQYPMITLTMVGDGEKYEECLNYIQSNHLEQNVYLEGWQTETAKYYSSHDIFVMSSIYESFGLIFLEAGYYKLPIIATNVEGIPEVVADGETGLLSPPRDPESMAKNIIRLIEDDDLRIKMGEAGNKRVTTLFTSQRMVDEYKTIYESV